MVSIVPGVGKGQVSQGPAELISVGELDKRWTQDIVT